MIATSSTKTKTFSVNGFTSWSWSKGIGGDDSGMLRIDVDGVQLVDSGVSTPSVPSVANTGCFLLEPNRDSVLLSSQRVQALLAVPP